MVFGSMRESHVGDDAATPNDVVYGFTDTEEDEVEKEEREERNPWRAPLAASFVVDLDAASIARHNLIRRLFLAMVAAMGISASRSALKSMLEVVALVAALMVATVPQPGDSIDTESNSFLGFGLAAGLARCLGLAAVILSILVFCQLSMYADDEIPYFVFKFAFLFPISIGLMIGCGVCLSITIVFDFAINFGGNWIIMAALAGGCPLLLGIWYVYMQVVLQRVRFSRMKSA
jgi:hypothetical protein